MIKQLAILAKVHCSRITALPSLAGRSPHAAHHTPVCSACSDLFSLKLGQNWTFCVCVFNRVSSYALKQIKLLNKRVIMTLDALVEDLKENGSAPGRE